MQGFFFGLLTKTDHEIILTPLYREDFSSFLIGSLYLRQSELFINWDVARNKEFTFEVRYVLLIVSTTVPFVKTIF
jgi:hypothetical protein